MKRSVSWVIVPVIMVFVGMGIEVLAQGRWTVLGRREVNFRHDLDRIEVGRGEGMFKEIHIRVEGAPIEMYGMVITFGNGQTFRPNLRHRFDEGSTSRVIDLPGKRRYIRHVDFNYRSIGRRRDRATIILSGR